VKSRKIRYEGGAKARRAEIVTGRGKIYRDCELIESDAHGLTFRHRDGIAKLGYGDMRGEMQAEFGYSPEAAKRERRERAEKARERAVVGTARRGHGSGTGRRAGGRVSPGGYFGWNGPHGLGLGSFVYTARPGSTNPAFSTNSLRQIVDYRNNGYSNISMSEQLYNHHFAVHAGVVYGGKGGHLLRPAVIAAPPYMPYVRNIYPRQIGTFAAGPSGGSLVPTLRSGFSQSGSIAPSLAPAPRR